LKPLKQKQIALVVPGKRPAANDEFSQHKWLQLTAQGGWSCISPGPAQFDGGYNIQKLPVGHSYTVYAEPLGGAVDPS